MPKLYPSQLEKVDKPLEELAHDFALLHVKKQMDSGKISTIGDTFVVYVEALDIYKTFLLDDDNLKDFINS